MLTPNNEATIIASPQVLAQDGKEAEIKVTTEEYFQITAEAGAFLRADLEKIETGTILRITPQVGPNGELTLDMNIEVSDVIARGEENLPVVSRRTARSTIQIENGGTAAVAGLVDTRAQYGKFGDARRRRPAARRPRLPHGRPEPSGAASRGLRHGDPRGHGRPGVPDRPQAPAARRRSSTRTSSGPSSRRRSTRSSRRRRK